MNFQFDLPHCIIWTSCLLLFLIQHVDPTSQAPDDQNKHGATGQPKVPVKVETPEQHGPSVEELTKQLKNKNLELRQVKAKLSDERTLREKVEEQNKFLLRQQAYLTAEKESFQANLDEYTELKETTVPLLRSDLKKAYGVIKNLRENYETLTSEHEICQGTLLECSKCSQERSQLREALEDRRQVNDGDDDCPIYWDPKSPYPLLLSVLLVLALTLHGMYTFTRAVRILKPWISGTLSTCWRRRQPSPKKSPARSSRNPNKTLF